HFVFYFFFSCSIEIDYVLREPVQSELVFGIALHHNDGTLMFGTNTHIEGVRFSSEDFGAVTTGTLNFGTVRCDIAEIPFLSGQYWLDVAVHREDGYPYDYRKRCVHFSLRGGNDQVGRVALKTSWTQSVSESRSIGNGES
ncbi:MAG: Wzt carbohydrate-binding domain-containing protein, partial [Bdellovibrionales bacterium]|nr:Wzt carbohydrate-binding domain-containing protein [Bdellovibrionales bacterium]